MGNKPSLRVSIQDGKWDTVRWILTSQYDGTSRARTKTYVVGEEQVSALHLACRHRAPPDVIATLIQAGQPMETSRPHRWTALHYSMMTKRGTSPEVVQLLLQAFPADVSRQATGNKTPLHLACFYKASTQVIRLLYDSDPTAAGLQDSQGHTAWDLARQEHGWILNPRWRMKVNKILNGEHVQSALPGNAEPVSVASQQLPAAPQQPAATRLPDTHHESNPPVAQAVVVPDYTTDQPPMAAAVVETIATTGPMPSAPMEDDENNQNDDMCVLCWDQKADMALIPCGHVCLCSSCCGKTSILNDTLHRKCPVCRRVFSQPLRLYQAGISSAG